MKTLVRLVITLAVVVTLLMTATTALAALPANMSWTKYTGNPVVNGTLCYSGEHFRPAVVVESANNYKMYFSDRSDGADVYLALTSDGGQTWTCANGGSPVLTRGTGGSWDDTRVLTVSVVKDSPSDYKMWYTGRNAAGVYAIGYATSSDGISWTKYGSNPVLTTGSPAAWDGQYVREPSVLNVGGTYHMWYSGTVKWPFFRIGHATSPDGITWTKDPANPVVTPVAGSWDQSEVYSPSVIANGGAYEMFFSGNSGGRWVTGHATAASVSGPWTQDTNAIISPDATGWEAGFDSTDFAAGVLDGSTWKLFYSAGGSYQIGLATLTNQAQLTFNLLAATVNVGSTKTIYIDLTAVTSMYGYQFEVNYDPSKVSAVGSFVDSFFTTVPPASIPGAWNASCAAGVCKFAVTHVSPQTAVTGSGTLAQIIFTGVGAGETPLTFTNHILADKDSNQLTHTVTTGFLTVFRTVSVSGTVNMQGRTYPTDTPGTVTIYDQFGYAPPTTTPFSASDGTWSASVAVDPSSSTFDIEASHSLYLTNRETGVNMSGSGPFPQPTTKLLGGDADNSGLIDVSDLSCIGGAFGGSPTVCGTTGSSDINADLTVNILDLVLAGGNYNLSSPQPWP